MKIRELEISLDGKKIPLEQLRRRPITETVRQRDWE
jgi:hypothetical protein